MSKKSEVQISLQGSISIAQAMSLMTGQIQTTLSFFSPLLPNDAQTDHYGPNSVSLQHIICAGQATGLMTGHLQTHEHSSTLWH